MSEAKLSTILLSLPPLGYLEMFQEMFFGFGDFCISFPRSIRPELVFCSITARSEWLVISLCSAPDLILNCGFLLLFLPWWRLMSYFLNQFWGPELVPIRLELARLLYTSLLSNFWAPAWRWPKLCKAFHFVPLLPLLWAAHSASPFSPSLSGGKKERFCSCNSQFWNSEEREIQSSLPNKKSKLFLKGLAFLPAWTSLIANTPAKETVSIHPQRFCVNSQFCKT